MKVLEKISVLSDRDNSKIWLVNHEGEKQVYKEIYHQPQLTSDSVEKSYENYFQIYDRSGLVEVIDFRREDKKVCVLMEYLDGFVRIDEVQPKHWHVTEMAKIIQNMVKQGFIDWDVSPINFMINPETDEIKMVDLDRVININDIPVTPQEPSWELTWFGSRVIKFLAWSAAQKFMKGGA